MKTPPKNRLHSEVKLNSFISLHLPTGSYSSLLIHGELEICLTNLCSYFWLELARRLLVNRAILTVTCKRHQKFYLQNTLNQRKFLPPTSCSQSGYTNNLQANSGRQVLAARESGSFVGLGALNLFAAPTSTNKSVQLSTMNINHKCLVEINFWN